MKLRLSLLITLLLPCALYGQQAKSVLDDASAAFKSANGIAVNFKVTTGSSEQGTSGKFYLKGNKFYAESTTAKMWFDGKTQWVYSLQNNEVTVSNPTAAELQSINPYAFLNLYKKGYACSFADAQKVNGKDCHTVRLLANNRSAELQEIILTIEKKTKQLQSVRMRKGTNNWTRISITSYINAGKLADNLFSFPAKEYSKAEIIDLR